MLRTLFNLFNLSGDYVPKDKIREIGLEITNLRRVKLNMILIQFELLNTSQGYS